MIYLGVLGLAFAIAKRLSKAEDRDKMIKTLALAISDDGKISPIEWATIGKRLGVFDAK
jgi:hypothetical protein